MLTVDEVGDVVHRPGTVEGIHSDQILEGRGLELTEVLLHPCRLELEGTHRPSRLVELIGLRVGQRDLVDIDLLPVTLLDIGQSLLDHREGLESEEVHLDQPCGLDHRALVLGHQQALSRGLVLCRAEGDDVADVHLADDDPTGMHPRATYVSLEHLSVLQRVMQERVRAEGGLLQLGDIVYGRLDGDRLDVSDLIGDELGEAVTLR